MCDAWFFQDRNVLTKLAHRWLEVRSLDETEGEVGDKVRIVEEAVASWPAGNV